IFSKACWIQANSMWQAIDTPRTSRRSGTGRYCIIAMCVQSGNSEVCIAHLTVSALNAHWYDRSLLLWLFCLIVQAIEESHRLGFSLEGENAHDPTVALSQPDSRLIILQNGELLFQRGRTDACLGADGFSQSLERDPLGFSRDQVQAC